MLISIKIYDRVTRKLKHSGALTEWRIEEDLLSSVSSEFQLEEKIDDINASKDKKKVNIEKIKIGDIIYIDYDPIDISIPKSTGLSINGKKIYRKLYYGIIATKEGYKITTKSFLTQAWNSDFPLRANTTAETNPYLYFRNVWNQWLKNVPGLYFSRVLSYDYTTPLTDWKITYDPDGDPETKNLFEFSSYMFKQVQHAPIILGVVNPGDELMPDIVWTMMPIGNKDDPKHIFGTDKGLVNEIMIFESDDAEDIFNCITILDNTDTVETFYLHLDGITVDKIFDPLTTRVPVVHQFEYYTGNDENVEYAKEQLGKLEYSHEITMDVSITNKTFAYFILGDHLFIRGEFENYNTIVTGFVYDSDNVAELKCGNIRTTLNSILDGSDKE